MAKVALILDVDAKGHHVILNDGRRGVVPHEHPFHPSIGGEFDGELLPEVEKVSGADSNKGGAGLPEQAPSVAPEDSTDEPIPTDAGRAEEPTPKKRGKRAKGAVGE